MLRRSIKGQSTAEYAIVIGLVLAAVIAMQVYVKRGMQGKVKDASDFDVTNAAGGALVGAAGFGVNDNNQYEPQYSISPLLTSKQDSTETATVNVGGQVKREIAAGAASSRTGWQETLNPAGN